MLNQLLITMEPKSFHEPFQKENFSYQLKWDGIRMLAFLQNKQIRLQNRRLKNRTRQYPEFADLGNHLLAKEAILDGEFIVFNQAGKPSFAGIIERDFATNDLTIKRLSRTSPVTYIVFDILYCNGRDLRKLPWQLRHEEMQKSLCATNNIYLIENFTSGVSLFHQVQKMGLEGIVAKEKNSPYVSGKSNYWLKIKNHRQQLGVICGYVQKADTISSLLLGAYHEDQLRYIGKASSGLNLKQLVDLTTYLKKITRSVPPFTHPLGRKEKHVVWVEPLLTVLVEFTEWTESLKMRAPVIVGFSSSPASACKL